MSSNKISYVHLHNHSTYSLGDAITLIPDMVKRVKDLGMKSIALTDHGTMAGVAEFMKECEEQEIKPIIGMEAYIAWKSSKEPKSHENPTGHLILLAKNLVGYRNLCALLEYGHIEGFHYKPRIDLEVLSKHSEGLIGLSACVGGIPQRCMIGWRTKDRKTKEYQIQAPQPEIIQDVVGGFVDVFGKENFFLEVMRHKMPEDMFNDLPDAQKKEYLWLSEAQRNVAVSSMDTAKKMGIRCVITNDAHYLSPNMMDARQAVLAVGSKGYLGEKFEGEMANDNPDEEIDNDKVREITGQMYIKSPEEMKEVSFYNQIPELVDNTVHIDSMIESFSLSPGKNSDGMPIWNLPDGDLNGHKNSREALRALVMDGLDLRYPEGSLSRPEALERAKYELDVMNNLGLEDYHLVVADFVSFARKEGIRVGPGRGSGAGSIVVYCLGITDLDPLRHGLLFERYLNPERIAAADLDVDFDPARVHEVHEYCVQKYGADKVAKIASYGSIHAKGSIRKIGRAMGLDYKWVESISKKIPVDPSDRILLKSILADKNSLANKELQKFVESGGDTAIKMLELCVKVDDVKISRGQHAAGIVISKTPLRDVIPLVMHGKANEKKELTAEIPYEFLEHVGLLKQDLLVVDGLTIIDNCIKFIRERHNSNYELPLEKDETYDDPAALAIFATGELAGVWQMSSHGMRSLCVQLKPSNLDDISAICALFRPGPLDYCDVETGLNMAEIYVKRKQGQLPVRYDCPQIEPALRNTYGVIVFQEQIMQIARTLCGWTYAQADYLRKAVGKKITEDIEKQKLLFIPAAIKHSKLPESLILKIWEQIETFGRYGFNASHSYAYGKLSYQMAYLKAHYPVEMLAACLSSASKKDDHKKRVALLHDFVDECSRKFIKVLGPDILKSKADSCPEGARSIRLGLSSIRGIASAAIKVADANLLPTDTITEVIRKLLLVGINKTGVMAMCNGGCFDSYGERNSIKEAILDILQIKSKAKQGKRGPNKKMIEFFQLEDKTLLKNVTPATKEELASSFEEYLYLSLPKISSPDPKNVTMKVEINKIETLKEELKNVASGSTLVSFLSDKVEVIGSYNYSDVLDFNLRHNLAIVNIL